MLRTLPAHSYGVQPYMTSANPTLGRSIGTTASVTLRPPCATARWSPSVPLNLRTAEIAFGNAHEKGKTGATTAPVLLIWFISDRPSRVRRNRNLTIRLSR